MSCCGLTPNFKFQAIAQACATHTANKEHHVDIMHPHWVFSKGTHFNALVFVLKSSGLTCNTVYVTCSDGLKWGEGWRRGAGIGDREASRVPCVDPEAENLTT